MKKLLSILLVALPVLAFAHPGVGIVMDRKGNVFYTDLTHIWKIDAGGKRSIAVSNVHSHELYIDENDNLFGEHLWYEGKTEKWGHYVWRLSATGVLTNVIPPTEGFLTDYSFVRDHHGNMFLADRDTPCQHITIRSKDGATSTAGEDCLTNIRWMTADKEGTVYLVDLHTIKQIDARGHVTTLARTEKHGADLHALMGISTDHQRNVYVSDYDAKAVRKITPTGAMTVVVRTKFPWAPTGQVIAPNGDYWILECNALNQVRVERITARGERMIFH